MINPFRQTEQRHTFEQLLRLLAQAGDCGGTLSDEGRVLLGELIDLPHRRHLGGVQGSDPSHGDSTVTDEEWIPQNELQDSNAMCLTPMKFPSSQNLNGFV